MMSVVKTKRKGKIFKFDSRLAFFPIPAAKKNCKLFFVLERNSKNLTSKWKKNLKNKYIYKSKIKIQLVEH